VIGGPVFQTPGRLPIGHHVGHDLGAAAQPADADIHGRSGFFWLVLPALFIARRLMCCGGPPRR